MTEKGRKLRKTQRETENNSKGRRANPGKREEKKGREAAEKGLKQKGLRETETQKQKTEMQH